MPSTTDIEIAAVLTKLSVFIEKWKSLGGVNSEEMTPEDGKALNDLYPIELDDIVMRIVDLYGENPKNKRNQLIVRIAGRICEDSELPLKEFEELMNMQKQ